MIALCVMLLKIVGCDVLVDAALVVRVRLPMPSPRPPVAVVNVGEAASWSCSFVICSSRRICWMLVTCV